jgi:hypothetical protein
MTQLTIASLKVVAFCDIDEKKIGRTYRTKEMCSDDRPGIPIIHFSKATPPILTCVALDRTNDAFEANVRSLGLVEGRNLFYFS